MTKILGNIGFFLKCVNLITLNVSIGSHDVNIDHLFVNGKKYDIFQLHHHSMSRKKVPENPQETFSIKRRVLKTQFLQVLERNKIKSLLSDIVNNDYKDSSCFILKILAHTRYKFCCFFVIFYMKSKFTIGDVSHIEIIGIRIRMNPKSYTNTRRKVCLGHISQNLQCIAGNEKIQRNKMSPRNQLKNKMIDDAIRMSQFLKDG